MKLNRGILMAGTLLLAVSLTACSPAGKTADKPGNTPAVMENQGETQAPETQTMKGTLNLVDDSQGYVVVINEDGDYCRFLVGDVDVTGLQPGDSVTVTYTGTIPAEDADTISAELVSLVKA